MTLDIRPVYGVPEIAPGDDLAVVLADALQPMAVGEGDIVVVTQKVVSKAEGRLAAQTDRDTVIAEETARIVARRGDLVIAETRHGFVCANAGVDASNLADGLLALLPLDPDASARRLRGALAARLGVARLGVVITDTFGRPWREGLVDVAIGLAGMPAVVDLRGTPDHTGRELEVTEMALADQVAAAAGIVMGKAERVPVVVVRGVAWRGDDGEATDLVRPGEDDLFRESPMQSLHARRTIRSFGPGSVPRDVIVDAVGAACTAPAPHHTRPWRFVALDTEPAKRRLLAAIADAWGADLRADGTAAEVIERRIGRSDAVLGSAPTLIVPFLHFDGAHPYPDAERARAEREMFLLSGGAAIQTLLLALHDRGYASSWISSTLFCQEETRAVLGMGEEWYALGTVACGPMPEGGASRPRPPIDPADLLDWTQALGEQAPHEVADE
ncbi:MAG TPA: coenzyme F420-0:L-glutamate ligase [Actinomycetota bacterium]|nr:coenzyme F420-0:L-glutamate ligase [Actinomycetota bacterium]